METMVPWHRTITINRGSTSICPGLNENKSAKAQKSINITLKIYTKGYNLGMLSPLPRLENGM